jgi:small basic protein
MTTEPTDMAIIAFLCVPVVAAAFVSWAIVRNLDKVSVDGWKRLFALNKVLINFYITVFITAITGARYVNLLGDQMFIGLLIASATALGIKISVDMRKKEE